MPAAIRRSTVDDMTVRGLVTAMPEQESTSTPQCWCCGDQYPESELVRLGEHPEVGICLDCARSLRRRANARYDERRPSPAARLRAATDAVRQAVIRKGWHERGTVGALLRRIDRHLP
ncbi:hypothetical protein [Actinokineospora sp.]|uniref:hypothetical protein n=1 Tax=Actinokineospora sp. TaxID=1872133 RepID=UPI003D6C30DB